MPTGMSMQGGSKKSKKTHFKRNGRGKSRSRSIKRSKSKKSSLSKKNNRR
jgi:hypothetical protein